MTDQVPRPMNKIPPAIRINWSPLSRVSASAPPIVAPIAVAAVRPKTAPGRTLAQGWRVARLMVTSWVLSPISRRATTPRDVAKTRRLSTEGGERPRGYDALDGRFLGRRNLSNVFQIHERIVEFWFFQAEDGIRDLTVTGVQTCALPISPALGQVNFPTSCSKEAQPSIETGVALLHSFQYEQAGQTFAEAAKHDPKCAMSYWGDRKSVV